MAFVTGTAANLRDAVEQIRTALTTNSALAAATPAQTWVEQRYVYDNLASTLTNMSPIAGKYLDSLCRNDQRLWSSQATTLAQFDYNASGLNTGVSYWQFQMRTAKAVTSIMLKAPSTTMTNMVNTALFQYSDNGTTWTTAYTISGQSNWSTLEERTFTGWAATGAHVYWRLLFTSIGTGTTTGTVSMRSFLMYNGTELVNSSETQTILKGPGLAAGDSIYIGFSSRNNPLTSEQFISVHGFTAYQSNERSMVSQPGTVPYGGTFVALWDQPMPFWFTISGRRITGVFKVSSNYMGFYAGLFLPYSTAAQYPYPLAVGGSIASLLQDSTTIKYDLVSGRHSVFCMPANGVAGTSISVLINPSTLSVLMPNGIWEAFSNRYEQSGDTWAQDAAHTVYPHSYWGGTSSSSTYKPAYDNVGGGYTLMPHVLVQALPLPRRQVGELDGTKQISGQGNSSENTGTFGGHNWVVFQNIYRTAKTEYWALQAD